MKRTLTIIFSCLMIFLLVGPCFAVYQKDGYFSNDFIMSIPLSQSKVQLSAQIEYAYLNEIYTDTTGDDDYGFLPTQSSYSGVTATVIPLKVAYGLTDNVSVRLTVPFISWNEDSKDPTLNGPSQRGYGVGDARIEGLYQVAKETDSMPSVGINAGVKVASGKNSRWARYPELPQGTGSTDCYISGIFMKKMWGLTGKALLGYYYTGSTPYGGGSVLPGSAIISSIACAVPAGKMEYGAEIWGSFAGKDLMVPDNSVNYMADYTEDTVMDLSPYINFKVSDDLTLKAVLDIPINPVGTISWANNTLDNFRGVNLTLGANWMI